MFRFIATQLNRTQMRKYYLFFYCSLLCRLPISDCPAFYVTDQLNPPTLRQYQTVYLQWYYPPILQKYWIRNRRGTGERMSD